jgi:hypothetical protein
MKRILFALYIYTPDFDDGVDDDIRRVYERKEDAEELVRRLESRYNKALLDDTELTYEYYDLTNKYYEEDPVYNEIEDRINEVYQKYSSIDKNFSWREDLCSKYEEEVREDQERLDQLEETGPFEYAIKNARDPEKMRDYIIASKSRYRGARIEQIKLF